MRIKKNTRLVNPWLSARATINCLVRGNFCHKKWGGRASRTKKFLLNGCSFNHQCISKTKVKEFVFILLFLYLFVFISMFVFYLSVFIYKYMAYFRQWEHRCIIWGILFGKKGILLVYTPETDAIFNHFQQKNFFSKLIRAINWVW